MATPPHAVAAALAEATKHFNRPRALDETLSAIAEAARDTIPGVDHAGISILHRNGRIETLASTDRLVRRLDTIQYELREGPCVESVTTDQPVVVASHIRRADRWPNYVPRATEEGLRAQLALRLYSNEATFGSLNLYVTESDIIHRDAVQVAELFTTHAAIALGHARYEHQLNEALVSRKVIGQAIGVIMERYKINEDRAFNFLVRASSTSNIKLRDVAESVLETANEHYASAPKSSVESA